MSPIGVSERLRVKMLPIEVADTVKCRQLFKMSLIGKNSVNTVSKTLQNALKPLFLTNSDLSFFCVVEIKNLNHSYEKQIKNGLPTMATTTKKVLQLFDLFTRAFKGIFVPHFYIHFSSLLARIYAFQCLSWENLHNVPDVCVSLVVLAKKEALFLRANKIQMEKMSKTITYNSIRINIFFVMMLLQTTRASFKSQ